MGIAIKGKIRSPYALVHELNKNAIKMHNEVQKLGTERAVDLRIAKFYEDAIGDLRKAKGLAGSVGDSGSAKLISREVGRLTREKNHKIMDSEKIRAHLNNLHASIARFAHA